MRSRTLLPALVVSVASCSVPSAVEDLQRHSPPPAFGRPEWVRTSAGIGGWLGGIAGGIVSVVLLPVTYPISLLAEDSFDEGSRTDFLFFPATGGAALGHFLLGTPPDMLDYVFHRAWTDPSPMPAFDDVPPPSPPPSDVPGPAVPESGGTRR